MLIARNAMESERFGVAFARLDDPTDSADLERALRAADEEGIHVISTRIGTGELAVLHALEACGFRTMDTLVYYRTELAKAATSITSPSSTPSVRAGSPEDAAACGRIAASAFHDYVGHYHADPGLDRSCADAVYVDWATRLLRSPSEGQMALCTLAEDDEVSGFLVGVLRDDGIGEIVLNAVDPAHQGRGCYGALLAAYCRAAAHRGDRAAIISTQLRNYRVQRAWLRHGFSLFDSYHTLHRWRPNG